ncbi:PREDICTED: EF-hand calcium-binding domain-containing protein 14-like [Condylura cristata]|uniref:EF-hand calcium-binding domain-containing protein 14-like n=1 Tax=Condylura cristata TaxID=143302 RepID=UPI000643D9E1|nr:PREDICTED: EF-hand calcium-binding domain-containing protein 14-like [Condylura cristata]
MSTTLELRKMKGKLIQLYNYIHNLSEQFLSMDTVVNSLFDPANSQPLLDPVASKMNAFETRLENVTATLTNLQNRLEEELDDVFLKLSQLKDNVYFLEYVLNITQKEHLNYHTSTTLPFQDKEKKLNTPALSYATSSQNYISALPETAAQAPSAAVDSEISKEKSKMTISFIKNLTDLQVFFYGADSDANGYLTYEEIQNLLGEETPEREQLVVFDADDNEMFSYLELMRAIRLTE